MGIRSRFFRRPPQTDTEDVPISDLDIPSLAKAALNRENVQTARALAEWTEEDLHDL